MSTVDASHLEPHRRALRALAWRITGTVQDADEVVQDAFLTALTHPPPDLERSLRPWLIRVTANLARDRLRARQRRAYHGPWLPGPLPAEDTPDVTIAKLEAASFAWLRAAEVLSPAHRAVLVLRDVAELDVSETAAALKMNPLNVRVAHHRARAQLSAAPASEAGVSEENQRALFALLGALAQGDVHQVHALLHEDVVCLTDGGGRYRAAGVPVVGREKVAQVQAYFAQATPPPTQWSVQIASGVAWLVATRVVQNPRWATRYAYGVEVQDGQIRTIYTLLTDEKLRGFSTTP